MIALYLLAAHFVGDYALQTRWQAARKFTDAGFRTRHVLAYCLPFVPIAFYAAPTWRSAVGFLAGLYVLHFLTDTRRAQSTLGDVVGWWFRTPAQRLQEWQDAPRYETLGRTSDSLPPNPWTPIGILIDQTLHLCQLALLGGLLLQ